MEEDEKSVDAGAYRAVGFSYGHTDDSAYRKSSEVGQESSEFRPSFPVPESLLQCLVSLCSSIWFFVGFHKAWILCLHANEVFPMWPMLLVVQSLCYSKAHHV